MTAVPQPFCWTNHKPAIIPLPGLSPTTLPFPCSMIKTKDYQVKTINRKTINREFDHIFRFTLPTSYDTISGSSKAQKMEVYEHPLFPTYRSMLT